MNTRPLIDPASNFPRRGQMNAWVDAERAIYEAKQCIETMPADPLLTEATLLLSQAQDKVADYVDAAIQASKGERT